MISQTGLHLCLFVLSSTTFAFIVNLTLNDPSKDKTLVSDFVMKALLIALDCTSSYFPNEYYQIETFKLYFNHSASGICWYCLPITIFCLIELYAWTAGKDTTGYLFGWQWQDKKTKKKWGFLNMAARFLGTTAMNALFMQVYIFFATNTLSQTFPDAINTGNEIINVICFLCLVFFKGNPMEIILGGEVVSTVAKTENKNK